MADEKDKTNETEVGDNAGASPDQEDRYADARRRFGDGEDWSNIHLDVMFQG